MESENQTLTQRHQEDKEDEIDVAPSFLSSDWLPPQTRQAAKAIALLLFFSVLMFSIPFLVFFGTRHYLTDHFHLQPFETNAISVFASVISVNIIIGIYVYIAYKEPEYDNMGNVIKETQANSKSELEAKED